MTQNDFPEVELLYLRTKVEIAPRIDAHTEHLAFRSDAMIWDGNRCGDALDDAKAGQCTFYIFPWFGSPFREEEADELQFTHYFDALEKHVGVDDLYGSVLIVDNIIIDERYRGHGLGIAVAKTIIQRGEHLGCNQLIARAWDLENGKPSEKLCAYWNQLGLNDAGDSYFQWDLTYTLPWEREQQEPLDAPLNPR
jgi:GNAT superfamily N-acetyltransferase